MTFFKDRLWRRPLSAFVVYALGAGLAGAVGSSFAADSFVAYKDEPPAEYTLPGYSQVALGGNVAISAVDFYDFVVASAPTIGNRIPTNLSEVNFWLQYKYVATSGDTYTHEVPMPALGFGIFAGDLPKGYYRKMEFGFKWMDTNGNAQQAPFRSTGDFSMARIVVPNVQKIPVYGFAEWMNLWSHDPSSVLTNTVRMRNKFRDLDYPVSRLATNVNNQYKDNFGCAGWFQFRFYGFVDGFADGIDDPEDFARLPPGITVVPRITYCSGSKPDGVSGCATLNGTRIAIARPEYDLMSNTLQEVIVTLHEIAHTKGLDHDGDPTNLLHEDTSTAAVAIREAQCRAISAAKQFVTPDPWEEK